jgi:hypothetical protein
LTYLPTQIFLPTSYKEVNAPLALLLESVRAVLGSEMIGLYLHGSLASGDFNPQRSDVDFVVATRAELPVERLPELAAMHARITASGLKLATKLEGSYIPLRALRRYDPAHAVHPALRVDGSFDLDFHSIDWIIQSYTLREQGISLTGPVPLILIDPILPADLHRASLGILHDWWEPMLSDSSRLRSREYQAYAVLTMCRVLYTLQHGTVVSKPAAAHWALQTLDTRWAALVKQALAWPATPQPDQLPGTIHLIRFTLECSQEMGI